MFINLQDKREKTNKSVLIYVFAYLFAERNAWGQEWRTMKS